MYTLTSVKVGYVKSPVASEGPRSSPAPTSRQLASQASQSLPDASALATDQWTCHVWDTQHNVYAANASGELVHVSASGSVLSVSEPAGGVVITALVLTRDYLVAGCEDGVIRWISLKDGAVERKVRPAGAASLLYLVCWNACLCALECDVPC